MARPLHSDKHIEDAIAHAETMVGIINHPVDRRIAGEDCFVDMRSNQDVSFQYGARQVIRFYTLNR
jgi:hypothetical protein